MCVLDLEYINKLHEFNVINMWRWMVHSPLDRAVWVHALARDIMLCSWARHSTLTVPVSTQVYQCINCARSKL